MASNFFPLIKTSSGVSFNNYFYESMHCGLSIIFSVSVIELNYGFASAFFPPIICCYYSGMEVIFKFVVEVLAFL